MWPSVRCEFTEPLGAVATVKVGIISGMSGSIGIRQHRPTHQAGKSFE